MHREADDRQDRGNEEAVDLDFEEEPEDREEAEDDECIVKQRDDRRDAVAEGGPAEVAEGPSDEQHDQQTRERDGLRRVLDELRRERRTHDRRVRDPCVRSEGLLQSGLGAHELRREHLGRTDLDPTARNSLDGRLVVAVRLEVVLDERVIGSRCECDLEERATLELDARPESADREEDDARHDEQGREQEVPPLALDEMEEHG